MLELAHKIIYSYDTHSVIEEKFYINKKTCTMYQFYNILHKHNNLIYMSEMNKTSNKTIYKQVYKSN